MEPSRFWVGQNGLDDYTYICTGHLSDVMRPEDKVLDVPCPGHGYLENGVWVNT